jgi:hypothetical protein
MRRTRSGIGGEVKALIGLLTALWALAGHAQPVTLLPSGCGSTRICTDVANDSERSITIAADPTRQAVTVILDGKAYSSATGNCGNSDCAIEGLYLYAIDGTWVALDAAFTHTTRTINAGRAHYHITTWTLTSGSVGP